MLQSALHAGPIAASRTTSVIVNPLASIVIGVTAFGERLRPGPAFAALDVLALAVMCAGVVVLIRSPLVGGLRGPAPRNSSVSLSLLCLRLPPLVIEVSLCCLRRVLPGRRPPGPVEHADAAQRVLLVPLTDVIRIRKGRHRSDRPFNRQEIVPVQADDFLEDGGQSLGFPDLIRLNLHAAGRGGLTLQGRP